MSDSSQIGVKAARRRGRPGRREPQNVRSVTKALAIVELLARAVEPIGVSDVATSLGIPKATAHRLLATLCAHESAAYDAALQRYSLGSRIVQYGLMGLKHMPLHRVARPHLERLQRETLETAVLTARQGSVKVFVDQVEAQQEIRATLPLGERRDLFHGSSGHVILAFLTSQEREEYLSRGPFKFIDSTTLTSPARLRAEIAAVRKRGYGITHGDRATSIAAPIFDHHDVVVGSVLVCGPRFRFTAERVPGLAAAVMRGGRDISEELGFAPSHSGAP